MTVDLIWSDGSFKQNIGTVLETRICTGICLYSTICTLQVKRGSSYRVNSGIKCGYIRMLSQH